MYQQCNPNEMPGVGNTVLNVNRAVWLGRAGVQYQPGGGRIDGNNARDPDNTVSSSATPVLPGQSNVNYAGTLRAGLLMGKLSSGMYGASVLGITQAAILASATLFKVSIACGQEIIRRLGGVTGSLYLTGPAQAGGTVNQQAVTVTNVAATGDGSTYTVTLYAGVTYAAVSGSLVQPADGSQLITTFVDELDGIRVVDMIGNGITVQFPRVPIGGGVVNVANIVNYPADSALKAWVKAALRAVATGFAFSDDQGN